MSLPVPTPPKLRGGEEELSRWLVLLQKGLAEQQKGLGIPQYAAAPPYVKGAVYFDTTLNKLRVGGASGWETVTSA